MSTIASRDLRNHTADVLRQVVAGATVVVTVHGEPVAQIVAVQRGRQSSLSKRELVDLLAGRHADAGLRADLANLAGDTTDDLDPIS